MLRLRKAVGYVFYSSLLAVSLILFANGVFPRLIGWKYFSPLLFPIFSFLHGTFQAVFDLILFLGFGVAVWILRQNLREYFRRFCRTLFIVGCLPEHFIVAFLITSPIACLLFKPEYFQTMVWVPGDHMAVFFLLAAVLTSIPRHAALNENLRRAQDEEAPIESLGEDRIGFRSLFIDMAEFILSRENGMPICTLALLGDWGGGKTSMMRVLRNEWLRELGNLRLEQASRFRFVYLSVADFQEVQSLYEKFYERIIATIEDEYLVPFLLKFNLIRAIDDVVGDDSKLSLLFALLNALPDLDKYHLGLSRYLERLNIRVILMLDDTDRLKPEDMERVFTLLRITRGLHNIIIVFSSDTQALGRYFDKFVGVENE